MGIEPTCPAWKAGALPLSYTRERLFWKSFWNRFFWIALSLKFLAGLAAGVTFSIQI